MTSATHDDSIWTAIAAEKQRDLLVRRLAIAGWTLTILFTLIFALIVATRLARISQLYGAKEVFLRLEEPVLILGGLSLLIATLGTIGVFFRMRTTTLSEIQLRLSALERSVAEPTRQ